MSTLVPGTRPSLTIAGREFVNLNSLIHLKAYLVSGNAICTPVKAEQITSGGYTPSGSKRFRVDAVRITVLTAVANTGIGFGYQDTDPGFQYNTSPTNGKQVGGVAAGVQFNFSIHTVGTADFPCGLIVPNGKYLYVGNSSGTVGTYTVDIFGYEIT